MRTLRVGGCAVVGNPGAPRCRGKALWLACVLSLLGSSTPKIFSADDTEPGDLVTQQLVAGEFAPALQLAEQAPQRDQRDELLAQVARAQAHSGGREAAISTAAGIEDDRARWAALDDLRSPQGAAGGGAEPDFESLIDLIQSTVAPPSWDTVGGPGSIAPFPTGVYVDAAGELHRALERDRNGTLTGIRDRAAQVHKSRDARQESRLRKVSLTRLEKQVQLLQAAGRRPTKEMSALAGLAKIEYVLVYPDSGDIVLAGPAGDWQAAADGRLVSTTSGRPVVQLDDLVVLLRYLASKPGGQFGCAITPTEESLANTMAFVEESNKTPLKPGQRDGWLKKLRAQLGKQVITVDGIDSRTRVAQVLVEADYRMKLVGMGLEEGALGVPSYLSMIKVTRGEAPPAMEVLRWWFTLNYKAVVTSDARDAFELAGQGVQVLSENELLTTLGKREHTGQSQPLNAEFAHQFTAHFAALAQKYPVYADLQNLFDLAMVSALVQSEDLAARVGWHMTCFGDSGQYQPALGNAPEKVETVMNHRVVNEKYILAGVSGGVHADPWSYVGGKSIKVDTYGKLRTQQRASAPKRLARDAWWWD